MTVSIEGAPKQYGTITYTVYLTNPEGVEFWEGNSLNGNKLDLGEGTLVSEAISLNSVSEAGQVIDGAYTIPAGTAYKYTFKVSEKYGTYSVYEKDGYYLWHGRLVNGSSQSNFQFPASSDCILAIEKSTPTPNSKSSLSAMPQNQPPHRKHIRRRAKSSPRERLQQRRL